MNKRALLVKTTIFVMFLVVLLRLVDLMLIKHAKLSRIAHIQQTKGQEILVRRGIIYDRKGRELAVNLERPSLYCDPKEISSPREVAYKVGGILKINKRKIIKALQEERRFVWLARKISPEAASYIQALRIEGIGMLPDTKRFYPKGTLAAHVLGFVNIDNKGLEGVERTYEEYLIADGGRVYITRDAKGNILYRGGDLESSGNSIVLTIDEGLQAIVEEELNRAVQKWHPQAATVIMMDPDSGEILALANRPTFDPNRPGRYRASFRRNRAITDLYEPGSTFKLVMVTAALEEGVATLNTRFDCSAGYIEVGGKRIWDSHKHGVLTLKEIIEKSSNVGAVKVALKLGPERFYKYVKLYGFGEKTGVDLIGESPGIVKSPEQWSATTIGAMAIGYEVMVTPLQVLRAYAIVANGGYKVRPHVVSRVISPEGLIIKRNRGTRGERIISERTVRRIKEALRAVVSEDGTAPKASIPGNTVAGKTGTTKLVDRSTGRYSNKDFVSSFVGMVPADNPLFVMIVVIWKPKKRFYGGEVAAPVFSAIAEKALSYMFIPRDDRLKDSFLYVSSDEGQKSRNIVVKQK
ncbi:MAG: penicillin-binding protein 2 [Nitrospirae bacterium]|nr:penicillin-binding protein 2 [Nitrospirota bacterium]